MSGAIATAFETKLQQQGTALTPDDLLRQYPPADKSCAAAAAVASLPQCRYASEFATLPEAANDNVRRAIAEAEKQHGKEHVAAILQSPEHHALRKHRQFDFRLNAAEEERLQQNGFVVSERLSGTSFAEIYYRLYSDDMPVYVTSDSVLHAWHRSFDAVLVELEEEVLMPLLSKVLSKFRQVSKQLLTTAPASVKPVLADVEVYLATAESLLRGEPMVAGIHEISKPLTRLLDAVRDGQLTTLDVLGSSRQVDFSLFKPRGHYNKTDQLGLYFQAMTWLGTLDFRVDGTDDKANDLYQLQCACLVVHLLRESKALERFKALHATISTIAGDGYGSDGMTPVELHELLGECDILARFFGSDSAQNLATLQDDIANQKVGSQAIAGHPTIESKAAAASLSTCTRLPTSFAFLGQQFVWSAFVFSKLVFDQVLHSDEKVVRRLPSALDAAFALLGNDVASEELAQRMAATPKDEQKKFVEFRDGLPYASNLVAVRQTVDEHVSKVDPATCSLAMLWQLALRELSTASANDASVFQSDAWKKRQMNTQLASFTELRHDTILYAKQSFTMGTRCEYAAGFVDPYPAFWVKMQQLGERTRDILANIKPLAATGEDDEPPLFFKAQNFFDNFIEVTRKLTEIAIAQAKKEELSEEQDEFIKNVMEERHGSGASKYLGWYPSLFYTHREDSGKQDHLVADVHTDVPSVEHSDPGGILHLGVGNVNLGVFVVNNVMYAGPVFSNYEFVTPINERLTDEQFSEHLYKFAAPHWARESFLVESPTTQLLPPTLGDEFVGKVRSLLDLN